MLVILDRQHVGRTTPDQGVRADLDGDGRIAVWEQEAQLTPLYLLAMERRLMEMGHRVVCMSDGSYAERHARAGALARSHAAGAGPVVYCAAHLNAAGGDYGLLMHDHRSEGGRALAEALRPVLGSACPELRRVLVYPARPGDWTERALYCLQGIYQTRAVGLVLEPCFVDRPEHRPLLTPEGLARIGRALAEGLHAWAQPPSIPTPGP